jgi:protein tyrosine phosphatase (PTP) superfamily phosphohydrolase (DUF442 family)
LAAALLTIGAASRAEEAVRLDQIQGPITWGENEQAIRVGRFWIAGTMNAQALQQSAHSGVGVVINLRDPTEPAWDEATTAADLGLVYQNIPVAKDAPFSAAAFDQIEAVVRAHPGETILLHCSTGNRAAAWLATHLVREQDMSVAAAIAAARKAGMTKAETEAKLRAFLAQRGAGPSPEKGDAQ